MRSPVVITNTRSVTEADLLVERLRGQGIDAVARTNLDRTTYGGLGGAAVLVDSDQRMEAELELILLEAGAHVDTCEAPQVGHIAQRSWIRVCGYVLLAAMALGTVVPSLAAVWQALPD